MVRATRPIRAFTGAETAAFPKSADVQSNIVSATLNQSGRETRIPRCGARLLKSVGSCTKGLPRKVIHLTDRLEIQGGSFCTGNNHPIKTSFIEVFLHLKMLPEWVQGIGIQFLDEALSQRAAFAARPVHLVFSETFFVFFDS
jgi:hypothetical protein